MMVFASAAGVAAEFLAGGSMAELIVPKAKRLQKPRWRDARLLVGVFLVLLAVTLGAKTIAAADKRVAMYAARTALKPGDRLGPDNLARVDVQLGDAADRYLTLAGLPSESYALREVRAGELVPASAVGPRAAVGVQPVTVRVDQIQVASLVAGSVVDVYVSGRKGTGADSVATPPTRLLEAVSIATVNKDTTRFGGASANASVQLLVPSDRVPDVISALDQEARISLVPVPGAASAGGS